MLRTPASTYRIQLHKGYTFDDVAASALYLQELGITHVYCSPYLQASPGSMHGYDVVDHQRVNDELGGRAAHGRFCRALSDLGLGQVLDIVPNHMSLGAENRYWWDVLENGTASRYASFFDIDWQPQEERLRDKVLVPVLADQYGRVLQAGDIKVARNGTAFVVEAASQALPVAPRSLPVILMRAAEYAKSDLLSFLGISFRRLPEPASWDRNKILARHRDKQVLLSLLARLCSEEEGVCEAIDRAVTELNANHDALDDFLNQQNYRLAYWKTADQQLGYRRFFDVNTLIGLRVEREHVFEETHALILDWLDRGVLDGVRVDHPDGLRDPLEYFQRLRKAAPEGYIVGEKILEPGEYLPESWPIEGTSGYDFLNVANGLLVRPEGVDRLCDLYAAYTGEPTDFALIAHDKKLNVEQEALGSDVNRLTSLLVDICENNRNQRDYTRAEARRALREVAACFKVYRTYVVPERGELTDGDREHITKATECARGKRTDIDPGLFDFMRDLLTMEVKGKQEAEFVMRFQQFTSPVMAKGVEDTAFYCFNRLVSLCEVGGDPGRKGLTVAEFHDYNRTMQATRPLTMTTLSTHDTKRADDVRARLATLSEIPDEFGAAVDRWSAMNEPLRAGNLPDRNTEWLLYQTLIGAWPLTLDRAKAYMQKATREAKQQTTWTANNKDFEDALNGFIEGSLGSDEFVADLERFVDRVKQAGWVNSLAQTLLKYTSPGVPDLYQGSELWDFSLVDPDNRRPVDYELRRSLLKELSALPTAESAALAMERIADGLPKLWLVHRALLLRKERKAWFDAEAGYTPLPVAGGKAGHAVAYLRGENVVTVVPRLTLTLGGDWQETTVELPKGTWTHRLTGVEFVGGTVQLETLFKDFPVALLTQENKEDKRNA